MFWDDFFKSLTNQSRDGAPLVYITAALAQLSPVRLLDSVDAFRFLQ